MNLKKFGNVVRYGRIGTTHLQLLNLECFILKVAGLLHSFGKEWKFVEKTNAWVVFLLHELLNLGNGSEHS